LQLTETKYDEINTRVSSNSKNECQLVAIKLHGKQLSSAAVAFTCTLHLSIFDNYKNTVEQPQYTQHTISTQHCKLESVTNHYTFHSNNTSK